jgi:putative CocE/NonD family hydrolase
MYRSIEEKNTPNRSTMVIGPWLHGGWARMDGDTLGNIAFGEKTGQYFRKNVELPFFDYYLKDKGKLALPEVLAFHTGANRWESLDRWPPSGSEVKKLYLLANGRLSFTAPDDAAPALPFDEYVSDPAKPVPFSAEVTTTEGHLFMVEDQRFAATRPDVLVYESDVLTDDLTIAGDIEAHLAVSTTGTDGDWVAKLIDVYPGDAPDPVPNPQRIRMGGFQMLLAGDIQRAKFRNNPSKPEPLVPGEVTPLAFSLGDKYHTFRKGHRVMVQIQSSWFPMFDRNPQRFVDIYHAKPSDYQRATQRVYRSPQQPSFLSLPVLGPAPSTARP